MLIDPSVVAEVRRLVSMDDFYIRVNGQVFDAILSAVDDGRGVDALTIAEQVDGVDIADIADLAASVPTALHATEYARLVRDAALRRQMIREAERLVRAAYGNGDPLSTLAEVAERLSGLGREPASAVVDNIDAVRQVYDMIDEWARNPLRPGETRYLATGLRPLDEMLRGLKPGGFYIVAARPSVGKTALVLQIASNVASRGGRVLFFTLETPVQDLVLRLVCSQASVAQDRLERGDVSSEELARVVRAMGVVSDWPIVWVRNSSLRPVDVRAEIARQRDVDLVVIDGLWLMASSKDQENRNLELGAISRDLLLIAGDTLVPIIAIHQLSRAVEQRSDKRPILADLRESGRLEENADVVLMLYRESYYNPEHPRANVMEIWVRKNRLGGPAGGCAYMAWVGQLMRLEELSPEVDVGAVSDWP